MTWAKIRFTLNVKGQYAEVEVGFDTEDIPEGAQKAALLCYGYKIGSGCSATIMQLAGHTSGGASFKIPQDIAKLYEYLERLRI